MVYLSLLREALYSLAANRVRSLLAVLGIVIGVASVIAMIAVGEGAQIAVRQAIDSMGSNLLILSPRELTKQHPFDAKLVEPVQAFPDIAAAVAVTNTVLKTAVYGKYSATGTVIGTTEDYFRVRDWPAAQGSVLSDAEVRRNPRIVVLGQKVSSMLFQGEDGVGRTIHIDNVPFQVVGILAEKGKDIEGAEQDKIVLLPLAAAHKLLFNNAKGSEIKVILAKVQTVATLEATAARLRGYLREVQHLRPEEDDLIAVDTVAEISKGALKTGSTMTLLLASIASVSLLVGGIGIMNIMNVCVIERTREIGIRRSLGATDMHIMLQFLLEALLIVLAGCAAGVCAAFLALWIAEASIHVAVQWSIAGVGAALACAAGVGLFFGYYPASKAARMLPAEALRYQ